MNHITSAIQSIKDYLSKCNRAQWGTFYLFSLILIIKTICFQWSVFHWIPFIGFLSKEPITFLMYWGGKITPILFVVSFIFVSKKQWWTIIFNVILDIWIIANLFYYKANALFLSLETMKMVDNMNGFWDSLYSYFGWDIVIPIILTVLYSLIFLLFFYKEQKVRVKWSVICLAISLLLSVCNNICYVHRYKTRQPDNLATKEVVNKLQNNTQFNQIYPFGQVYFYAKIGTWTDYNTWAKGYVNYQSIISFFPACILFDFMQPAGKKIDLSHEQIDAVSQLFSHNNLTHINPKSNLIFILFESLESWPINEVCGHYYLPFLSSLCYDINTIYCDKLISQVKHGNSADGQMIDITGVLPILSGATCILYGKERFPSYAEWYTNSAIFNPSPGVWRQRDVAHSYQFQDLIENGSWEDNNMMKSMVNYIDSVQTDFCTFGITISSHVPFERGATHQKHHIDGMLPMMSAYLNCIEYTDSCIHVLFNELDKRDLLKNTTIVISGDHTIFRSKDKNFDDFAIVHNINMQTGNTFTPLIIYSPEIDHNIQITDTCYQMDIYPTIMHLIGCEDYYWKGVGVNLLDSTSRENRKISEEEAYRLSDLLIRSNAFELYKQGKLFDNQNNATAQ